MFFVGGAVGGDPYIKFKFIIQIGEYKMTSKRRAYLRGLANKLEGKDYTNGNLNRCV